MNDSGELFPALHNGYRTLHASPGFRRKVPTFREGGRHETEPPDVSRRIVRWQSALGEGLAELPSYQRCWFFCDWPPAWRCAFEAVVRLVPPACWALLPCCCCCWRPIWLRAPAAWASADVNSCALPLAWAARPPMLAISRWRSGSIEAKPRPERRVVLAIFMLPKSFRLKEHYRNDSHGQHSRARNRRATAIGVEKSGKGKNEDRAYSSIG